MSDDSSKIEIEIVLRDHATGRAAGISVSGKDVKLIVDGKVDVAALQGYLSKGAGKLAHAFERTPA